MEALEEEDDEELEEIDEYADQPITIDKNEYDSDSEYETNDSYEEESGNIEGPRPSLSKDEGSAVKLVKMKNNKLFFHLTLKGCGQDQSIDWT